MKLTENFSKSEFDSKDGAEMPENILENIKTLANHLEVIRSYLNAPIIINSGYRSPSHNSDVGGKDESYHLKGMASDIDARGCTPDQVFKAIQHLTDTGRLPQGGMSAYPTFVHWDYRGHPARW